MCDKYKRQIPIHELASKAIELFKLPIHRIVDINLSSINRSSGKITQTNANIVPMPSISTSQPSISPSQPSIGSNQSSISISQPSSIGSNQQRTQQLQSQIIRTNTNIVPSIGSNQQRTQQLQSHKHKPKPSTPTPVPIATPTHIPIATIQQKSNQKHTEYATHVASPLSKTTHIHKKKRSRSISLLPVKSTPEKTFEDHVSRTAIPNTTQTIKHIVKTTPYVSVQHKPNTSEIIDIPTTINTDDTLNKENTNKLSILLKYLCRSLGYLVSKFEDTSDINDLVEIYDYLEQNNNTLDYGKIIKIKTLYEKMITVYQTNDTNNQLYQEISKILTDNKTNIEQIFIYIKENKYIETTTIFESIVELVNLYDYLRPINERINTEIDSVHEISKEIVEGIDNILSDLELEKTPDIVLNKLPMYEDMVYEVPCLMAEFIINYYVNDIHDMIREISETSSAIDTGLSVLEKDEIILQQIPVEIINVMTDQINGLKTTIGKMLMLKHCIEKYSGCENISGVNEIINSDAFKKIILPHDSNHGWIIGIDRHIQKHIVSDEKLDLPDIGLDAMLIQEFVRQDKDKLPKQSTLSSLTNIVWDPVDKPNGIATLIPKRNTDKSTRRNTGKPTRRNSASEKIMENPFGIATNMETQGVAVAAGGGYKK